MARCIASTGNPDSGPAGPSGASSSKRDRILLASATAMIRSPRACLRRDCCDWRLAVGRGRKGNQSPMRYGSDVGIDLAELGIGGDTRHPVPVKPPLLNDTGGVCLTLLPSRWAAIR